jgi:putative hydrolase of the HAD superfamily
VTRRLRRDVPSRRSTRAPVVLLDAMGTLLRLEPPVPALVAGLAAAGHPHGPGAVEAALRAEIAHYRAHHLRGRDAAGLGGLRRECAAVLGAALDDPPPAPVLLELLLDALRFAPYPDAPPLLAHLAAAGVPAVVVSDWDVSLHDHLRALGLADGVAAVVVSAAVGATKPDGRVFRAALDAVGAAPGDAVHCGDDPRRDLAGARAAGIRGVLLDREGVHGGLAPRIRTLAALPALL